MSRPDRAQEERTGVGLRELGRLVSLDLKANAGNPKGQLVCASYRVMAHLRDRPHLLWLALPLSVLYQLLQWGLGVEIPAACRIGPGLAVFHGQGLVVHEEAVLGAGCVLRHNTTIGAVRRGDANATPVIGDRVDIGANSVVLGGITLGDGCVVGAGSVVVHDVPAGATVVGNPARVVARPADDGPAAVT